MPRTFETVVYTFKELSEEAQQKALDNSRDWNVDALDWWESAYEDAERIGAKISSFDADRRWTIEIKLQDTVGETVRSIMRDHGKDCDTFKLTQEYYRRKRIGSPMDVDEFTQQLGECYLTMLSNEYDYLTGDESIKESLISNDCEFTEEGELA